MVALDYGPGDVVIKQGDTEDQFFFVVCSGQYSVHVEDDPTAEGKFAALTGGADAPKFTYVAGGTFGELALKYGNARKATIRCDVGGTLWALARDDYLRLRPG